MGAIASLEQTALQVVPGAEVDTTVRVRNAGAVVDEFTFEVVGPAAAWATVEPAVLRLLPGDEESARVVLAPPRTYDVVAGDVAFGIKVISAEDPDGSVVEEGVVAVGAYADITAELIPRTSQGIRRGRHELAVDNRGNDVLDVDISATDPDELLNFVVAEPRMLLEPGTAAFTYVDVRPRKKFWRGPNKTLPFTTHVAPAEALPIQVEGTYVQKPMLPKWLLWALLGLLALLLLLWLLWATLLRPTIESTAQQAVEEALETPLAQQSEAMAAASEAAAEQAAAVDALTDTVNDLAEQAGQPTVAPVPEPTPTSTPTPTPTPSPSPSPTASPSPPPPDETNTDFRLAATDAPGGGSGTDSFAVDADATLLVSDIVLQNPVGNEGRVRIRRGDQVLLDVALQNFRDLDYHFVTPLVFADGQTMVLEVECDAVTAPGSSNCQAAALVSGVTQTPAEPAA